MKPYSLSHFVIPDSWEHEGCIYVEPLDWWKNCYKIEFLHDSFLVNADNESEAMDSLIDWLSDNIPGYLLDNDDLMGMTLSEIEEHYCGGNDGRYLNELSYRSTEVPFPYVLISIAEINEFPNGDFEKETRLVKQKVDLQNLQDFHEFDFTLYDAEFRCVKSRPVSKDGFPPYHQFIGQLFLPDGRIIEDKYFYDWLLEVVF